MSRSISPFLRAQVGQLFLIGFEGTEASARLRTTLSLLQPCGVILFGRNIVSALQTHELLAQCRKSLSAPALLGVDLEGGTVDRLREVIAPAPSAAEIAASGSRKLFRRHGQVIGEECRALGFNVTFAPVVDLGLPPSRNVMGTRTASANPEKVVEYARAFLRGLKEAGVLGCVKHFPGLGAANLDTHLQLPAIMKSWKHLWEEDLLPYRSLHREAPFVMVSHAAYPQVTRLKTPATLSKKWTTGILKKRIGFRGLVLSDDMEMGALLSTAPIEVAAVESLRAGVDILLICREVEKVWAAYESVVKEAERDWRFARMVEEKAKRIAAFKRRSGEIKRHAPPPTQKTIDRLRREIWELSEQARVAAI